MENITFESKEFTDLMKNKEFIEEINSKKTREEIKDTFSKNGIEMTDENLDKFADCLEKISIGNVSGGKKFSEAVGDFIDNHPWLTFFTVGAAITAVPQTVAAIRGKPLIVK